MVVDKRNFHVVLEIRAALSGVLCGRTAGASSAAAEHLFEDFLIAPAHAAGTSASEHLAENVVRIAESASGASLGVGSAGWSAGSAAVEVVGSELIVILAFFSDR